MDPNYRFPQNRSRPVNLARDPYGYYQLTKQSSGRSISIGTAAPINATIPQKHAQKFASNNKREPCPEKERKASATEFRRSPGPRAAPPVSPLQLVRERAGRRGLLAPRPGSGARMLSPQGVPPRQEGGRLASDADEEEELEEGEARLDGDEDSFDPDAALSYIVSSLPYLATLPSPARTCGNAAATATVTLCTVVLSGGDNSAGIADSTAKFAATSAIDV